MQEIPKEILDLAVRRNLDGSRARLTCCPICGHKIGNVGIFACNKCWLNYEDELLDGIIAHVEKTKIIRAMLKKLE